MKGKKLTFREVNLLEKENQELWDEFAFVRDNLEEQFASRENEVIELSGQLA